MSDAVTRLNAALARTPLRALLTVLLVSLAGCGGTTDPPIPPPAATVTLSLTTLSFGSFGDTQQLIPTVRDQGGAQISGASVTWESSSSSVASVSSAGLVAAVANGTATITATSGSASGTASVDVNTIPGTWELVELDGGVPRTGETWTFTATTAEFPGTGQCIVINTYTRVGSTQTFTFTVREFTGSGCDGTHTIGDVFELEATVSGDTLTIVTDAPVGIAHHISTPSGHLHVRVFLR